MLVVIGTTLSTLTRDWLPTGAGVLQSALNVVSGAGANVFETIAAPLGSAARALGLEDMPLPDLGLPGVLSDVGQSLLDAGRAAGAALGNLLRSRLDGGPAAHEETGASTLNRSPATPAGPGLLDELPLLTPSRLELMFPPDAAWDTPPGYFLFPGDEEQARSTADAGAGNSVAAALLAACLFQGRIQWDDRKRRELMSDGCASLGKCETSTL